MIKTITHYWKIYRILGTNVMNVLFASYADFTLFFIGKTFTFFLMLIWILSIFNFLPVLRGYNREQILVYFAVSFILDKVIQILFFRGFFSAPSWVNNGTYDKMLTMPVNSIFLTAFRITDWNDIFSALPGVILLIIAVLKLPTPPSVLSIAAFFLLFIVGLMVAFSILLSISALSFIFVQVDNLFMLYRELVNMTKFPPEIYGHALTIFLSTVIPIFLITATPAKAILGSLNVFWLASALGIGSLFFYGSIQLWKFGVKRYTSASS